METLTLIGIISAAAILLFIFLINESKQKSNFKSAYLRESLEKERDEVIKISKSIPQNDKKTLRIVAKRIIELNNEIDRL